MPGVVGVGILELEETDVNYMGDYFTDVEVEGDSSVIKEDMSYGAPQGSRQYCFNGTLCVI